MGHITHAKSFRLGASAKPTNTFANKLSYRYLQYTHRNVVLLKFLKIFFMMYTFTFSASTERKLTKDNINENFLKRQTPNPFAHESIGFSHATIARGKLLYINCYLFDTKYYETSNNRNSFIRTTPLTLFTPIRNNKYKRNSYIELLYKPKWRIISKKKRRKTTLSVKIKPRRNRRRRAGSKKSIRRFRFSIWKSRATKKRIWFTLLRNHRYKNRTGKKFFITRATIKSTYFYKLLRYKPKKYQFGRIPRHILKSNEKLLAISKIKLINKTPVITKLIHTKNVQFRTRHRFRLIKILLKTFKQNLKSQKLQLFAIIMIRGLLQSLRILPGFKPTFIFCKLIVSLRIKELSLKHLNLYFYRYLFKKRITVFTTAFQQITAVVKTIEPSSDHSISFSSLQTRNLRANHLVNYISVKLSQYFKLPEIMSPLYRLLRQKNLLGYRILVVGRLNRRERAAHIMRQRGSIPLSSKKIYVDYAQDFKIMRFGVVGIKVWLNHRTNTPHPMLYTLRFWNATSA